MPYPIMHNCAAIGCTARIGPRLLMCRRHWMMLPLNLRSAVWEAYRDSRQHTAGPIPRAFTVAVANAQNWLVEHEHGEDVA